jgi:hypothetical protein
MKSLYFTAAIVIAGAAAFTCSAAAASDGPEFVRVLRPVIFTAQRENRADAHLLGDNWSLRGFLRAHAEAVDNVFAVPAGQQDDVILLARPAFELNKDGDTWDFDFDGFLQQQYFADGTNDEVTEGGANAGAAVNFSTTHRLSAEAGYLRNVQERTDPDETGGQQPEEDRTYARLTHYVEWGLVSLRAIAEARRFDFLNAIDVDRDRIERSGSIRFRYAASERFTPYVGIDYSSIDFQGALDDFGFDRDGERLSARIGFLYRADDAFYLQMAAGNVRHTFDDAAFSDFDSFIFEVDAIWNIDEKTSIVLDVSQSENVTTLAGASARVRRSADLRIERFLTNDVAIFGSAGVRRDQFEDTTREDDFVVAAIGIEWLAAQGVNIFADYRYTERDSTDPGEDYELNAVRVGAKLSF